MPPQAPTPIYRITHYKNVPWILAHGCHCRNSSMQDPNFVNIGNPELIDKRASRTVSVPPGGSLNDYVPFYFAPHSIMLYNIHTGRVEGVSVKQAEIVYLVSSIERLQESQVSFVFTDGHAFTSNTRYFTDTAALAQLEWATIRSKDFRKRLDDPDRTRRYQAECLVHRHLPAEAIIEIVCKDSEREILLQQQVISKGSSVKVLKNGQYYF
jgi:hypothetical protein